ncbi:MAG: efflux RND transporter permease subunit [Bacteroidetes bacterium]|nr:MAG: efflux RND transporter permease subunit [Bacteroidota bacterium]
MLKSFIRFFLENKLVTVMLLLAFVGWGMATAPFDWDLSWLPRDPVPVDAIPDIGENQQIVFTEWMGRSPQDIEDQITYPLTTALLGIPGVKTIRSNSMFGLSSIYLIFEEEVEFYWSRSRILEKLNSLPPNTLPDGVQPALGPDATALGQVFWYTLEGRSPDGKPTGGWDPQELRSLQDFYVGYALTSAKGVSEVAPIGGFVKEYQVDIDPDAMKAYGVNIAQIMQAVKTSNLDVGAKTMEFNRVEYLIRGLGYVKSLQDLEESVVAVRDNVPVRIKDVAKVNFGPETRRGGLDKGGAEAVGAVVVARYGSNPMEVIQNVKAKIKEIAPGLPSKTLADGTVSKVTIVPFYDRTGLIKETLGTLESALTDEILISIIVVIVLVLNLRASILISSLLPIGVLMTFIAMHQFGVDANIVALSGIAIAIGVMVDVGVVFSENMLRHLEMPENKDRPLKEVIYEATTEVSSAVVTAIFTTIVSFLPVFAMEAAEGKLFKPLAFTKTFAMIAALLIGLAILPTFGHWLFGFKLDRSRIWNIGLLLLGLVILLFFSPWWAGLVLMGFGLIGLLQHLLPHPGYGKYAQIGLALLTVVIFLSSQWLPLGAAHSLLANSLFVGLLIALVLGSLVAVVHFYPRILHWCLHHKLTFLMLPLAIFLFGILTWQGFDRIFGWVADGGKAVGWDVRSASLWQKASAAFPGIGQEFMPSLDEGSFLLMPTTMPHSGVAENIEVIRTLDLLVESIPEVESVVGKWGRVRSALDPAPISMYENVINYKPEYILDEEGHRVRFKVDKQGNFVRDEAGELIPDRQGKYYRNWRAHIHSPDDIWQEIVNVSKIPGMTSAPKLQPIQTRLIMISTGMRAPLGIKVFGPDLQTIEQVGLELESILQQVPSVSPASVFADRVVGKPYLEIAIDRAAIARYGLSIQAMQGYLEGAIGGMKLTSSVEGRERYPIRVRYARELRDQPEALRDILIPTPAGAQVPLEELASIQYVRGPQNIKSENTFLVSYVIFDMKEGYAEVDVVEDAQRVIEQKIQSGEFVVPPGVSFKFAGNYENQLRASKRLSIVVPICLLVIFLILYFEFRSPLTAGMVFTGVFVAFSGGFLMLWLYGQPWFLDFTLFGENMRDIFMIGPVNLSVAVWVGFIALFGISTEDGVIMGTYLRQTFEREKPHSIAEVREAVLHAGRQRIRPAMMTAATTIIALMPVLTSTGKGADIMLPMAIPTFGGMVIQLITVFVVPVLYCAWQERKVNKSSNA